MVTLVIPVFNKVELTRRCLESVLENSRKLGAVIVVNNASQDETPAALLEFQSRFEGKQIRFQSIQNETNLGFGSACNQGVRLAKSEYIAILNNDTWVMPGWDEALIQALAEEHLDVVGPHFDERPWSENMNERAGTFLNKNKISYRTHFVPILMFFKREAVKKLAFDHGGIFDELFFVTYEDTDLLYRMKQLNLKFAQTSRCYIWHQSMGTRSQKGLLPEGYEAEGLKRFIKKWGFDPRKDEHTFFEKLKRRYRKRRAEKGMFKLS